MKTSPTNDAEDSMNGPSADGLLTMLAWFGAVLLGAFVLLLLGSWVYSLFYSSLLGTLRDATRLATFLGNLLVVFYAFPAFVRTRDRAFLCISAAALCFGYGGLFSILFGIGPPTTGSRNMSHSEAHWYYVGRYAVDLIGLFLYAYGIITLARRATPNA